MRQSLSIGTSSSGLTSKRIRATSVTIATSAMNTKIVFSTLRSSLRCASPPLSLWSSILTVTPPSNPAQHPKENSSSFCVSFVPPVSRMRPPSERFVSPQHRERREGDPATQSNEGSVEGLHQARERSTCVDPTTKMACGAESSCSAAKRAKVDKEDPLVLRRKELILEVANARVAMNAEGNKAVRKVTKSLLKALRSVCADLEAANHKLLGKLPPELWSKIVDENVQQNDLLALAMTCRFFREKQKGLGWKLETNLKTGHFLDLRKSGRMPSHSLGWFCWVGDTMEILPGYKDRYGRVWVKGAVILPGRPGSSRVKGEVYEGNLVNYAAFQGNVEILRWLMEEKGWEPHEDTGKWAGTGGSVEVLEYLLERGYEFDRKACEGAARGGCLEALKFLRGLDPPCPWGEETCARAAEEGHLEVLKWARAQEPPCPWNEGTCNLAAQGGHLEVLKWARSQDPPCPWSWATCSEAAEGGQLEVLKWARAQNPPCPWSRCKCRRRASKYGHQHVVDWIDQQEDESDVSSDLSYTIDEY